MEKAQAYCIEAFEVLYESYDFNCPKCGKHQNIMIENREYKNPVTCSCGETFIIEYD